MSQFAEPQLLKKYDDKTFRVVSLNAIEKGSEVVLTDYDWIKKKYLVNDIIEARPSMGVFPENKRPTSYRINVTFLS